MRILVALLLCGGVAGADARLPATVRPEKYDLTLAPDLGAATFAGIETIAVHLDAPTREITLHARDLVITRATAGGQAATVTLDAAEQTATLHVATALPAGAATLTLAWTGKLDERPAGLHLARLGSERYSFTQFEPVDARRAFPCFDEPALKARFTVTAVVDAAHTAYSNGAATSEKIDAATHKKTIHFRETPPISSYLVALATGPLAELKGPPGRVPVRVIAAPSQVARGRYAAETAARIVARFEDYFGVPFPYEKLDLVAAPSLNGGMENAGAIFCGDSALLIDDNAPARLRRRVALLLVHEIGHQWFGDLVTTRWWDDLWLNEAFAEWTNFRIADLLFPDWDLFTIMQSDTGDAMSLDELASTHPIVAPVSSPGQAIAAFDAITYNKGAAVLRMLETWLGEETWRRGLGRYLKAHALGSAVSGDLWRALEEESHQPVAEIARVWTERPGVPVVRVSSRCVGGATEVDVAQERSWAPGEKPAGEAATLWPIPVCVRDATRKECTLVREAHARLRLAGGCAAWIDANAGANGYYRVRYDDAPLAALMAAAPSLTAPERLALVRDQWALAQNGQASVVAFLDLLTHLKGERAPLVLGDIGGYLRFIDDRLIDNRSRPALARLAAEFFGPAWSELGWTRQPGETDLRQMARGSVLFSLGTLAPSAALGREIAEQLARYLAQPSSVDSSVIESLVHLGARAGDEARWRDYRARSQNRAAPEEGRRFLGALAGFEAPGLINRTLALTLDPAVPSRDVGMLLGGAFGQRTTRPTAWRFFREHFTALRDRLSEFERSFMLYALGSVCDAPTAREVAAFLHDPAHVPAGAERAARIAERTSAQCVAFRQREAAALAARLK